MARYFKKLKNGVLDGVARAETKAFCEKLIAEGYIEISQRYYGKLMQMDLYISYRYE